MRTIFQTKIGRKGTTFFRDTQDFVYFYTKKEAPKRSFPEINPVLGRTPDRRCSLWSFVVRNLTLFLVIFLATNLPEVSFHRLLAVSEVLLGEEGGLVLGDLRQVFLTLDDHLCHGLESQSNRSFVVRQRRRALRLLTQVQSVTFTTRCRRHSVGTKQHLLTTMLRATARFTQCARHMVNSRTPFYFCHFFFPFSITRLPDN